MEEQSKYKVKDIILLDDNRKYFIIRQIGKYYLLMADSEPFKIMLVKILNNKIIVETNKEVIKEVLSE